MYTEGISFLTPPKPQEPANDNDFTKTMQDMMAKFPMDSTAMQTAFKNQAAFGEKMAKVALEAAEKSTEVSSKWAKDTLAKLSVAATAKTDAAD